MQQIDSSSASQVQSRAHCSIHSRRCSFWATCNRLERMRRGCLASMQLPAHAGSHARSIEQPKRRHQHRRWHQRHSHPIAAQHGYTEGSANAGQQLAGSVPEHNGAAVPFEAPTALAAGQAPPRRSVQRGATAVSPRSDTPWDPAGRLSDAELAAAEGRYARLSTRRPQQLGTRVAAVWGLGLLALAYVHHSTTGFALPALLPLIAPDLGISDTQGAVLTLGYTVLYAVVLVPMGFLADKVNRPRLLSGGLAFWSLLTMAGSKVGGFGQLLAARVGFAAAQATQNPICFSLIPELFPRDRTTAMAIYNSAIYMGRALSFAAVIVAGQLGAAQHPHSSAGDVTMVPLNDLDLQHVSILFTQGEMAAIAPIYGYSTSVLPTQVSEAAWRQLLYMLGPPGLLLALAVLLTLSDPREEGPPGGLLGGLGGTLRRSWQRLKALPSAWPGVSTGQGGQLAEQQLDQLQAKQQPKMGWLRTKASNLRNDKQNISMVHSARRLLVSRSFQWVTFAAALNDIGGWALISWHATFYTRVFALKPEVYAPLLAAVIPLGGIVGGVGGGLAGDWLSRKGARWWLTGGATVAAAPVIAVSLLAPDYQQSFAALLVGFALSEAWRAPAAIMIRDVSPTDLGSTGSALHLCIRNLIGGMGPLGVAALQTKLGWDLQHAMLVVPVCFTLSGVAFFGAEAVIATEQRKAREAVRSALQRASIDMPAEEE